MPRFERVHAQAADTVLESNYITSCLSPQMQQLPHAQTPPETQIICVLQQIKLSPEKYSRLQESLKLSLVLLDTPLIAPDQLH